MKHTNKKVWLGLFLLVSSSGAFCLNMQNAISWWSLMVLLYIVVGYVGFILMKRGFE